MDLFFSFRVRWYLNFKKESAGIAICQKSKLNVVKCPHILKVVINTIWNTDINELLYYTTYRGKDVHPTY
jgi:hypothetical protein